ncbi:hemagglutinin repeat-containing protein [Exercitatus varius]|uniref:hemagglutinin repeat-containing protein n=1 Tax=Exercitatus varius TaxID=67857 RepID=UPI00374F02FE
MESAVAIGKGRENSDTVTQVNTHIKGDRVSLRSQQNTELRGAVVNANKLNADIGGNLTIESPLIARVSRRVLLTPVCCSNFIRARVGRRALS